MEGRGSRSWISGPLPRPSGEEGEDSDTERVVLDSESRTLEWIAQHGSNLDVSCVPPANRLQRAGKTGRLDPIPSHAPATVRIVRNPTHTARSTAYNPKICKGISHKFPASKGLLLEPRTIISSWESAKVHALLVLCAIVIPARNLKLS